MTGFYLGVDGGQSGTKALIADEQGHVLGVGLSGPCNHVSSSEARAKLARVVTECVLLACSDAGLPSPPRFEAACFGMSGGPADKESVLRQAVSASSYVVTDDARIALAGALAGEPGIVTIAGTGSIALARNPEGVLRRAGGWGYVFGDEGGAFDIVRQALRACLSAEEGWGPATSLSELFLIETGQKNINDVLHCFYKPEWPRSRVAKLASGVDACASEGDEAARQVLMDAAKRLAGFAQAVRGELWGVDDSVKSSYVGGVFGSSILLQHYKIIMEEKRCPVIGPRMNPAAGALVEAYRVAGRLGAQPKLLSSKFLHE